jgi:hypothetical protein
MTKTFTMSNWSYVSGSVGADLRRLSVQLKLLIAIGTRNTRRCRQIHTTLSTAVIPAVGEGSAGATGRADRSAAFAAMLRAALDFGSPVGFLALGLDFAWNFEDEGPFEEGLDATEVFSF